MDESWTLKHNTNRRTAPIQSHRRVAPFHTSYMKQSGGYEATASATRERFRELSLGARTDGMTSLG
jgi:hypothetical protein